jgi:DNA-directed RNA polymerase specialized sigma24 family protein
MPRLSPNAISLSKEERVALERLSRQYTAPYQEVIRAKIVLLAAEGFSNTEIANRLDIPRQVVSKWRARYCENPGGNLADEQRSGRPATFSPSGDCRGEGAGL